ncbi:glucans biosynthesis glucosyltransferase MdoH [Sphingomonas sp. GM_Shp_1]|uniref:glucans biosynthesis glucosyltransferase MdoH n=1 Tax=Sphingomonas sp. GM_Shp_1 TaxID=2937381 RepID=UPI00226AFFFB|nr:glucans biosynthesis glucosyltransferase MdoH [Sphingomonas sp. GM_Shp_1]
MTDAWTAPRAIMPEPAPLTMPVQRFDGPPPPHDAPEPRAGVNLAPDDILTRRLLLVLLTGLLATAASASVKEALLSDGFNLLDGLLLLLFFPLFAWISFGFVTAAIGFILLISGAHPGITPAPRGAAPLTARTAVLVPVHNEDVEAVFDRIARMATMIDRAGAAERFAFFVLSDSSEAAEAEERAAWARLAPWLKVPLYYRRRTENIGRKPGNVAEWVRNYGAAYDFMLMLDADSLMGGDTMVGMAQIMEQRPSIALLQTVPMIIGATTFFQRWMQFASRFYGPISTAGLVWWSGSESTFWGHNALIRIRAFAESCGLPDLPGRPPFGGTIMSHDMVEAALLRRRGWRLHMLMVEDSFEEFPPTLIDQAVRDRRWAQGNTQHLKLLGSSGFHWISRLQLFIGALAYLMSPAWLILIATSIAQSLSDDAATVRAVTSTQVLVVTLILLFGPKLLSIIWAMADRNRRASYGGARGILASVALDVPLSILTAPVIALTQTIDLINIVRGKPSGWNPQSRVRDGLAAADAMPRYYWHLGVGVVLLGVSFLNPMLGAWLSPVTLGLLLAPWLAMQTAKVRPGERLAKKGVFAVPGSEVAEPARPLAMV